MPRPLPDHEYCFRDGRNERIKELEAENVRLRAALEPRRYPTQPPLKSRMKRRKK